jgi:UvrD/REP helicase N-terminal domain
MQYVAVTQDTCAWLLGHANVMNALQGVLFHVDLSDLRAAEYSAGPLRIAGSSDGRLLAIWNKEYVSGTGSEAWGVFRLTQPFGLASEPTISRQVLERILYVLNQRLQSLVIESEFIHRTWPNGSHTCLAGRGTEARQFSIAYFEGGPGYATLNAKAMIVIGPEHDFDRLQSGISAEMHNLAPIVGLANEIIDQGRRRPLLEATTLQALSEAVSPTRFETRHLVDVNIPTEYRSTKDGAAAYSALYWDYNRWIESGTLNEAQRRVLESDALMHHPVRVIGPAGSGKTLLMQLLAMRYLNQAQEQGRDIQVLYIVHNLAMAQTVSDRFRALGAEEFLTNKHQTIVISTLSEYGRKLISLPETTLIDKDAYKTKAFQLEQVKIALRAAIDGKAEIVSRSALLRQVRDSDVLFDIFALLAMAEISTVIKGRGLVDDEKRYTDAEAPLSRLHRILNPKERSVVFDCFRGYNRVIFEEYEMLDSDDMALTLSGRLRTPLWSLKRRTEGFDFVFVDEAQLFNENERRLFPYLTKGTTRHIPIALALDEAQEPFGFSTAGLATLGITDIENENLPSIHRSTREIVDLAFYVIQQTTDLFGADFPDFTNAGSGMVPSTHPLAAPPVIVTCNEEANSYTRFLLRLVQRLRAKNIRQIAIICHHESYWTDLVRGLEASRLPYHIIAQRGEKINPDQPLVILSRPALIGGQEFDAVVLVGLEQGLVPPRVADNPALAAALEQQVLREIYLALTRARYRVIATLNRGAGPNAILTEAVRRSLIAHGLIT